MSTSLIAAVMNFTFRDEILPYYGGGTAAARHAYANDFMYWEVMRRAAERGLSVFDFGRSKRGTGAFSFEKNWGFEPTLIVHRYRLAERVSGQSLLNGQSRSVTSFTPQLMACV